MRLLADSSERVQHIGPNLRIRRLNRGGQGIDGGGRIGADRTKRSRGANLRRFVRVGQKFRQGRGCGSRSRAVVDQGVDRGETLRAGLFRERLHMHRRIVRRRSLLAEGRSARNTDGDDERQFERAAHIKNPPAVSR